jgi:hypothetical protein
VPVLVDSRLTVEDADGGLLVVDERRGPEPERGLAASWPDAVDVAALESLGVGWVAVTDPVLMVDVAPPGTSVEVAGASLQLVRIGMPQPPQRPSLAVLLIDLLVAALALAPVVAPVVWSPRARSLPAPPPPAAQRG